MRAAVRQMLAGVGSRRLAALAALAALAVVALAFRAGYDWRLGLREEAAARSLQYSAWTEAVAATGQLEARLAKQAILLGEMEKGLLDAANPSIAAAVLQRVFRGHSARSGVALASERALPPVESGRYLLVPVEFRFSANVGQLRDLLSGLRASGALIGVRSIRIGARAASQGRLDVTLVLEGALRRAQTR